jgi:hypothetical protein
MHRLSISQQQLAEIDGAGFSVRHVRIYMINTSILDYVSPLVHLHVPLSRPSIWTHISPLLRCG